MVGVKDFPNPKADFKFWEAELYKTMKRVGVSCERVYKPKFRVSGRHAAGWIMYEVTNRPIKGVITYGDHKEKNSCKKSSG